MARENEYYRDIADVYDNKVAGIYLHHKAKG